MQQNRLALAADELPTVFGGAAFDAFASLVPPPGLVDMRLYFYSGCVGPEVTVVLDLPAEPEGTATAPPDAPTSTPEAATDLDAPTIAVDTVTPDPSAQPTIAPTD